MAIDPLQAAKFACKQSDWSISNVSLQKILYFSHLAFLGENGELPLVDEIFEAWKHGPVLRPVYNRLIKQGVGEQALEESHFQGIADIAANDNREEVQAIKFFSNELKNCKPFRLAGWSHSNESAWKKVYDASNKKPICNQLVLDEYRDRLKMPDDPMGNYLRSRLSRQKIEIKNKLIVALDYPNLNDAKALVQGLGDKVGFFKIGMELFFQKEGIAFAQKLKEQGNKIFFDAKSFDIPRTVEAAIKSLNSLEVDFISIHSVSISLLKAMAKMPRETKLVGITLLTSMGQAELRQMGSKQSTQEVVMSLAKLAMTVGKLDGLVASGQEVVALREKYPEAIIITPGIRHEVAQGQDHKRVSTPRQAIAAGADHIVVGRPITQAKDPVAVVEKIFEEVEQGVRQGVRQGVEQGLNAQTQLKESPQRVA